MLAKPTYVEFPLSKESDLNLREFLDCGLKLLKTTWARSFHSTTVYSRSPIIYEAKDFKKEAYITHNLPYSYLLLKGKESRNLGLCLTLRIDCDALYLSHIKSLRAGATWDFPEFFPHITLAYNLQLEDLIEKPLVVPNFPLVFDKERIMDLDENWSPIRS